MSLSVQRAIVVGAVGIGAYAVLKNTCGAR